MHRRFVWALFALFTAIAAPIGCSAGNTGVGGGGEQNILAPTVTGNVICFPLPACEPVYIVITATQFTAWTPSPTVTLTASPTQPAPTLPSSTPRPPNTATPATPAVIDVTSISNPEICLVEPYSERVKGTYEYRDFPNYGVGQNIRIGPGVSYSIVPDLPKSLPKGEVKPIFWLKWVGGARWVALNNECTRWVNGELGILDFD